jgi:hypothetical protein
MYMPLMPLRVLVTHKFACFHALCTVLDCVHLEEEESPLLETQEYGRTALVAILA